MGIEFYPEDSKSSQGWRTSSGGCDLPVSGSTDWLFLTIGYGNDLGLSSTLNTPTVGGVAATLVTAGSRVSVYAIAGATTGFASFTFSTNPSSFWAWCVRVSGLKASGPWTNANSATATGFAHQINSAVNSPHLGSVFLGAIGSIGGFHGYFHSNDNIATFEGADIDPPGSNATMLSVAAKYATAAAQASFHSWTKTPTDLFGGVVSGMAGVWLNPLQAPSAPVVTLPLTNGKFTAGSVVRIAYDPATDPNVDTEDLTYIIDYSADNGNSWTNITTTGAGVLFYDWTTGAGGIYKVRVRADNGTDEGANGESGSFQLFTDVPPGPPTNLSPVGYISQAARDFTWTPNNPDFDSQSAYELEWSSNANMSSSSTTGTVVSTDSEHAFTASTDILSSVGTKYWRVRTKGAVDNTFGSWSEVATVIVAAAPATPTITSASTATTASWPVTFTAIAHNKFRHRWILSGTERFNSIVQSSAFGFSSPFNLANGQVWTLKVSVFDPASGLESAEASQTLTVTYTGPATPTVTTTALDNLGAIQVAFACADVCDHFRVYRYVLTEGASTAILISKKLASNLNNGLFLDHQANSGITYGYFVRAYKVTTLGFSDSLSSFNTQLLTKLHLHVVDKTSTTSNAGLKVALEIVDEITKKYVKKHRSVGHQGREKFVTYAGQAKHTELTYNCIIKRADDTTTFPALQAVFDANQTLCMRDFSGQELDVPSNKIFGRILELPKTDLHSLMRFNLTCIEEFYQESFVR